MHASLNIQEQAAISSSASYLGTCNPRFHSELFKAEYHPEIFCISWEDYMAEFPEYLLKFYSASETDISNPAIASSALMAAYPASHT